MNDRPNLSARAPRLDGLTGLRWWAAFLVFTFHMGVYAPIPGPLSAVFAQGYFGVTFFFVLSGFVLTWSASSAVSQSTFYWRRVARIYPSHIVALLLAIPVFYDLGFGHDAAWVRPFDLGILSLSLILIQGWWLVPAILFSGNPAAWTLTCEAFFYAIYPYVSKLLSPRGARGALMMASAVLAGVFLYRGLAFLFPESGLDLIPTPLARVGEFVLGMALAWAVRCGWRPRIPVPVGIGAIAVVIGSMASLPTLLPHLAVTRLILAFGNELVTVAFALTIVAVAVRGLHGRSSVFATPLQVRLGEWSFAFYLVHASFIYIALAVFGFQDPSWGNLLWFVILFVVALVASAALHHGVEKPLERRMRRWKDERDARKSADSIDPVATQD